MADASEIRSRIEGIRETKKITDAMYMISSAKMRRALRDLEETTPYFETLSEKIGELLNNMPKTSNRYFRVKIPELQPHRSHGIILITADKGLAGVYNQEAINVCEKYMKKHPKTTVFIIGEYGRQYFQKKKLPFVEAFHYPQIHPLITDARRICIDMLEYYNEKKLDDISIIYTDYMGARPGRCKRMTLLPLDQTQFQKKKDEGSLYTVSKQFIPSPDAVLDGVVPSYLMGFIYDCLVESFCSEQQARMIAMKNAGDNADEMLQILKLQYNKLRQAAITNEMLEITAGVRALKRRRKQAVGDKEHEEE